MPSSREAELVGVYDAMLELIWTKHFLGAQGYMVLFQDNKPAMLLEKNERKSSTKQTKHINVHNYFVQDRRAKKSMDIQFCPTEDTVVDF